VSGRRGTSPAHPPLKPLSIVATLYRSAPFLREFHERICREAAQHAEDFEIVLVNDGSPDESLETALALQREDPRVTIIDLSRNFGHHKAMMTGLARARGRLVFLIDSDLEEAPELLGEFWQELTRTGADVVYGVQMRRKGGLFERLSGRLFFTAFNLLSTHPLPPNVCTVRLMTRRFVRNLVAHRERETVIAGLWSITGFRQVAVPIRKEWRRESSYSLASRLVLLVNSVTSFSNRPLILVFYMGFAISLLAGTAALYLIVRRVFFGELLAGWASVIVSIWLLGGMTLFCLGLVGLYVSRVFIETKKRPYTVIRAVYAAGRATDAGGRRP